MDKIWVGGLVVFAALAFVYGVFSDQSQTNPAGFVAKIADSNFLRVATIADCSYNRGKVACQDNIYYTCGNITQKVIGNDIQCNNITISLDSLHLKNTEFGTEWKDPRD